MKHYNRLLFFTIVILVTMLAITNILALREMNDDGSREYLVEIERLTKEMQNHPEMIIRTANNRSNSVVDLSGFKYIKKVICCEDNDQITASSKYDYCIRSINQKLYRFEYEDNANKKRDSIIRMNMILICMAVFLIVILVYIKLQIIKPFEVLQQIPYDLSKGKLGMPMKEEHTRYFGKFIWGTNLLREHLEERRIKELNMHRDKKLLLLSLTHDIKTPLSVIKLNSQALSKGLYKDEEKRQQAAVAISSKVDEIEQYVSQIIDASRDDFLDLSVNMGEYYLKDVLDKIQEYNVSRLELSKTEFTIEKYDNCLLSCDLARLTEVLQNLIENAYKYGDGQKIVIDIAREEDCCLIIVENTGVGPAADDMPKLFDSFYRGSNVKNQSGSGLGLYICRKLMHNMNGDIFAKREEGVFSVTVVVPLVV